MALVGLSLAGLAGCSDANKDPGVGADKPFAPAVAPATATASPARDAAKAKAAKPGKAATKAERKSTFRAARKAVDKGDYTAATSIAAALPKANRKVLGQRVSNRLARAARSALKEGNRSRVLSLLAQAEQYPKTALMADIRADYLAAEKAFDDSGRERVDERSESLRRLRGERRAARARAAAEAAAAKKQP